MTVFRKAFCINCGKETSYHVIEHEEKMTVRNTGFSYWEATPACIFCHGAMHVPWVIDMNAQRREEAYTKAKEKEEEEKNNE